MEAEPEQEQEEAQVLLEIKAGRMTLEGTRVVPDTRKGLLRLIRLPPDSLLHVRWEGAGGEVEDDQLVFPHEAVFEKVTQSPGRVYILRFLHDSRKFFYWMQGRPAAQDDQELCRQVNHILNEDDSDSDRPLPGQDLEPESEPEPVAAPVQLIDLQRILNNLSQQQQGGAPQLSAQAQAQQLKDHGPGFSDIFRPEIVLPLLEQRVVDERLAPYLPEGMRTLQDIADLMPSPQFQQQLDAFTAAVRSGQIDLTQFGIHPSTFVYSVTGFLEAIEDLTPAAPGVEAPGTEKDKDKDDDTDMDCAEEK